MEMTAYTWLWPAFLGAAGAAMSAWLAQRQSARPAVQAFDEQAWRGTLRRLGVIGIAAATAAVTGWMIGGAATPAALGFLWIGFVTAGWIAAERDKLVLHRAVCSAATAPAAHPDTVQAMAHASPDAVYEAVQALVPRRVVR